MPIYWSEFDWQSFATLATGLAAVAGATVIGRRQTAISERQATIAENQTEILRQQTTLAELTLRHDLFDRRVQVYDGVRRFLGHIIAHASPPDNAIRNDFLTSMNTSKLLFRPLVFERLQAIWRRAGEFGVLHSEMTSTFNRDAHYGDGNPERERIMLVGFSEDMENLIELFGDELKLSAH